VRGVVGEEPRSGEGSNAGGRVGKGPVRSLRSSKVHAACFAAGTGGAACRAGVVEAVSLWRCFPGTEHVKAPLRDGVLLGTAHNFGSVWNRNFCCCAESPELFYV